MASLEDLLPLLAELSRNRGRASLEEVAEQLGTSRFGAQRRFSHIMGESPKQYSRRLQLELAAALLLTTSDSVLNVALSAGFESHEGFTRAFRGHFGRSPRDFRRAYAGLAQTDVHAQLLQSVGPCVRLFGAPLHPPSNDPPLRTDTPMSYDIIRQTLPAATVLCKGERCTHAQAGDALQRLMPAIFQELTQRGLQMVGPPMALYSDWGPSMVTIRGALPIAGPAPAPDGLEVLTLSAGDAFVTVHSGPYDGLGDAHAAIEQKIATEGLKLNAPAREVYLTDPGEVPDPKDWRTQIVWPIA